MTNSGDWLGQGRSCWHEACNEFSGPSRRTGGRGACSEKPDGAEIEQAVVSALYTACAERRELGQPDLIDELSRTRPLSVTMAERIVALRARGRRAVPSRRLIAPWIC